MTGFCCTLIITEKNVSHLIQINYHADKIFESSWLEEADGGNECIESAKIDVQSTNCPTESINWYTLGLCPHFVFYRWNRIQHKLWVIHNKLNPWLSERTTNENSLHQISNTNLIEIISKFEEKFMWKHKWFFECHNLISIFLKWSNRMRYCGRTVFANWINISKLFSWCCNFFYNLYLRATYLSMDTAHKL